MGKPHDLTGKRFGRWTVLERDGKIGTNIAWKCRCDCGTVRTVRATVLVKGRSLSCGCKRIDDRTTHNGTGTRLFNVWRNIKERCLNENYFNYPNYGGRGIKICDEWNDSFESFRGWAVENGYKEGLTIDRIDVNGNYEPSNCRWATTKVQARNRRTNHIIECKGEKHCVTEWAEKLGVKRNTLFWRLSQGWPTKEVLFGRA